MQAMLLDGEDSGLDGKVRLQWNGTKQYRSKVVKMYDPTYMYVVQQEIYLIFSKNEQLISCRPLTLFKSKTDIVVIRASDGKEYCCGIEIHFGL